METAVRDEREPWYHGSQQQLTVLRAGSSITRQIAIARAFSHRPTVVSLLDDGRVRHDGSHVGYLYVVDETITPDDRYPHPHPINESEWEWLTRRDLRLRLIAEMHACAHERLTAEELAELRQKQAAAGQRSFHEYSGPARARR